MGAIAFAIWLIVISLDIGLSRILTRYALAARSIPAASEAIRLAPGDADAHLALGVVLQRVGDLTDALAELERATALRPQDYDLWLELGIARDENNDPQSALLAFNQAVQLAPYYAQPLWQRGNLLLRMGQYDQAFKDLRAAAASNPDFVPGLIDLCWGVSRADANVAQQLLQPTTNEVRLAFAQYLAKQGRGDEAVEYFRSAGSVSDEEKRDFVADLIAKNSLAQAFEIWSGSAKGKTETDSIYDGGFEGPLTIDESGFGWRVDQKTESIKLSLDTVEPHTGIKSLRIDFAGESNPDASIVSQLVLVKSSQTYHLGFAARSKEIVTGGLPYAVVESVGSNKTLLGHSGPVLQGTTAWQPMDLSFTTGPSTRAVLLSIRRQPCSTSPCPAFGTLWLDSFGLEAKDNKRSQSN